MKTALIPVIVGFKVPAMEFYSDDSIEYKEMIHSIVDCYPQEITVERTVIQVIPLESGDFVFAYELLYTYNSESYPRRHIEGIVAKWLKSVETSMESYLIARSIPYAKL